LLIPLKRTENPIQADETAYTKRARHPKENFANSDRASFDPWTTITRLRAFHMRRIGAQHTGVCAAAEPWNAAAANRPAKNYIT